MLDQTAINSMVDAQLAAWLRGEVGGLSPVELSSREDLLLRRVGYHGIGGLLALNPPEKIPPSMAQRLRQLAVSLSFWEAHHRRILESVLAALNEAGLHPLLFKGSALAYVLYDQPWTRARADTDILVGEDEFEPATAILSNLGFSTPLTAEGAVLTAERSFRRSDPVGGNHEIDLHSRLSNSQFLSKLFAFGDLQGRSEPLPELGPGARRLGDVDSLLVACVHRLVHGYAPYYHGGERHLNADRLIWLIDIARLSERMGSEDFRLFWEEARARDLSDVAAAGIEAAMAVTHAKPPPGYSAELVRHHGPVSAYLRATNFGRLAKDFGATRRLSNKVRFVRQLLLPSPDYMRVKFGGEGRSALPWLYLKRAGQGLVKHLRP